VNRRKWLAMALVVAFAHSAPALALNQDEAREKVIQAEHQRCEAISSGDIGALSKLLADDYVHVHGSAKIDNKAGFIENVKQHPRRTDRGDLTVRFYGEIAVVTGKQFNYVVSEDGKSTAKTENVVTQVLHRAGGQWQFVSFQLTPVPPPK
jgi:ketosteroid isomerase-like protein